MSTLSFRKLATALPKFTHHWNLAATKYPLLPPLLLHGEVSRAEFAALAGEWTLVRQAVKRWEQEAKLTQAGLEMKLLLAVRRIVLFNQCVRGFYPDSPHIALLAAVPAPRAGLRVMLDAIQDTELCWVALDGWLAEGGKPPLVMADGFDAAQFAALVQEIAAARWEASDVRVELAIVRSERDADFAQLGTLITAYRASMPGWLPQGAPLAGMIPHYAPPRREKEEPEEEAAEVAPASGLIAPEGGGDEPVGAHVEEKKDEGKGQDFTGFHWLG